MYINEYWFLLHFTKDSMTLREELEMLRNQNISLESRVKELLLEKQKNEAESQFQLKIDLMVKNSFGFWFRIHSIYRNEELLFLIILIHIYQHIRARLIVPPPNSAETTMTTNSIIDGYDSTQQNYLRAMLMAPYSSSISDDFQSQLDLMTQSSSSSMLSSFNGSSSIVNDSTTTTTSNDYAIDITHVEKFVQDSPTDSLVLDQK